MLYSVQNHYKSMILAYTGQLFKVDFNFCNAKGYIIIHLENRI